MAALAEAFVRVRPNIDVQEFRRQTEKAMRESGGSIKVALDSSQVRRDLTVLRAEIGKLAGKDITVGVDVTQAYVDVATLREEITKLGRIRPTVRADADTARAMAQVAALTEEVRRLDGLNPTIRPDVDDSRVRAVGSAARDSSSGVSALVTAGIALGPAIIPVAGAAAAAVAGIGAGALAGVAGIGVVGLAVSGVADAVKAMGAASQGGAAAVGKLAQSMGELSPEGQRFATFIYGLRTPVLDLRRTAEGGLLPGAQAGITDLMTLMPTVTGQVGTLSRTVGDLSAQAGAAFAAPYWRDFITFIGGQANTALHTFAGIAYNSALGVSALVRAFLPLGQDVGGGLLHFSEQFAQHALTLQNTQGYRDFLDYVRTQGPIVAHTIGEVVTAAVRLIEATAPIGGVTLTTIRLLAQTINALPVPVLTLLAGAIISVVTATKAWDLANSVLKSSFTGGVVDVFSSAVQNAKLNMSLAEGQTGRFGLALQGLKGAGQGAGSALGALAAGIGPGGALAAGVGIAVVGLGILATKMAEQKAKTEAAIASYERFGDAVAKARAAGQDDNTADLIKNDKALQDLILHANQYGVSGKTVVDALAGQRGAFSDVNAALAAHRAELVKVIQEHTTQGGKGQRVMDDTAQAASNEVRHLDELAGRFGTVAQDQARAKDAADLYNVAQAKVTTTVYQQTPVQKALGDALNTLADKTKTAADQASALRTADEAVFGAARAAIRSQEDQAAAEDAVAAAGERNAKAHIFGAATLDLHTEAGRTNRRTLEDRLLALGQEYLADVQAGVGVDAATTKHDTNRDALINAAKAAGFDTTEVGKLVTTFGTLPTDPKVQVTVSGVQTALTQLENLEIAQLALKQGLDPSEATRQYKKQRAQANNFLGQGGLATGGPVFGPGGPTDDQIPVWLSNGEHVITAREVQAAGGHGAIEAIRKTILGGASPKARYPGDGSGGLAFAGGGAVQWPFPTTAAMTRIPSLDEIRRVALFGPDYTGPISGGMDAAAAFVRAQVGKPYIWASAGPFGYDCSGIVSAAWNVAHGHDPYSHTFSTMNEAPYFPLPGYGPFTAAWTNPGERGPGGDSVGHTAARIGNFAFESIGGQGVRVGSSVTPLGSFAHIGHYADGGPVTGLPVRSFDSGGWLPPNSTTVAVNGTSQWEPVGPPGRGGDGITIIVNPPAGASTAEIVAAVKRDLAWEM